MDFIQTSKWALVLAAVVSLSANSAMSQGTSEAEAESSSSSLYLTYFMDFDGPSVAAPIDATRFDDQGERDNGNVINVFNEIEMGYKPSANTSLVYATPFSYDAAENGGFSLGDMWVAFEAFKTAQVGLYSLGELSFQVHLPTSESSQAIKQAFSFVAKQKHKVPFGRRSNLAFKGETKQTIYFYAANSPTARDLKLRLKPGLNYRFNDKLNTDATAQFEWVYASGAAQTFNAANPELQLLLNWQALERLSVSPYVKAVTKTSFLKNTTLGVELFASIL